MPDISSHPKIQPFPGNRFISANYLDATCIDGFLWDMDQMDNSGEVPCPICNPQAFIAYHADELNDVTEQSVLNWIDKMRVKYS